MRICNINGRPEEIFHSLDSFFGGVRWKRNRQWIRLTHHPSQSFYQALLGGMCGLTDMFWLSITRAIESSLVAFSYSCSTSPASIWSSSDEVYPR
jgi:hypothetical protein